MTRLGIEPDLSPLLPEPIPHKTFNFFSNNRSKKNKLIENKPRLSMRIITNCLLLTAYAHGVWLGSGRSATRVTRQNILHCAIV